MSRLFMLGAIGSAGGSRYWFTGVQGTGSTNRVVPSEGGLSTTPNNDIILTASDTALTPTPVIYRISSTGKVLWQRNATGQNALRGANVDSTGANLALSGSIGSSGGATVSLLSATNPTSSVWAKSITGATGAHFSRQALIDSSSNVYSITRHFAVNGGVADGTMVRKYNSSGVIQWTRTIYGSNDYNVDVSSACLDSNNDVIICGMFIEVASGSTDIIDFYVAKISGSSGAVSWTQRLTGTDLQGDNEYKHVSVDSSNNIFLNGYGHHATAAPDDDLITIKYNTSGTLQWQRRITFATGNELPRGIVTKANGSVIVAAEAADDSSALVNYDTNGNIVWQRKFTNFEIRSLAIDKEDDMIIAGLSNTNNLCIFKLPSDGSKTGTYTLFGQSIVYSTNSGTAVTSSFTAVTSPTITNSTATTTTTTTPTYSFATISKTLTRTSIL